MSEESTYLEILMSILMESARRPEGVDKESILAILATHGQRELYDLTEAVEFSEDGDTERLIQGFDVSDDRPTAEAEEEEAEEAEEAEEEESEEEEEAEESEEQPAEGEQPTESIFTEQPPV